MSWQAVQAVLEHSAAHESERLVLICIADRADDNRQCYPSIADIARRARLNAQVTSRIINRLVAAGELIRWLRVGASTRYIVTAGLTPAEVEAHSVVAWNLTVKQVEINNKDAKTRLSRSKGNAPTLRANIEGSKIANPSSESPVTLLAKVEGSNLTDPSSEGTPPFERKSSHPSSDARTEPSIEPSIEPSVLREDAPTPPAESKSEKGAQEEKKPRERDLFFDRLVELTHSDPALHGAQIGKTKKQLLAVKATSEQLDHFEVYWRCADWRGQKGQPPTLANILGEWGRAKHWQQPAPGVTSQARPTNQPLRGVDKSLAAIDEFLAIRKGASSK